MTPQERQLLKNLFDRLAALENAPRDPDAVDAINEGLDRAPNALYPLVQTALVQDEALKRAAARIRELEDELGIKPADAAPQSGFLDSMRDTLLGSDRQGSVPSVRQGAAVAANKWGSGETLPAGYRPAQQDGYGRAQQGYPEPQQQQPQPAAGGSFLGTAAAAAAGAIGGAMLMNSMRGLFGGQQGGQGKGQSAFDQGQGGSPWSSGSGGGDLARQAGLNDIGQGSGGRAAAYDDSAQRTGLFDTAQNDALGDDDHEDGDDFDFGDSDTA